MSWTNCTSYEQADYVFVGLPDESHSHSIRKGTSQAPDRIRKISCERDIYFENNKGSLAYTNKGKNISKIFDFGNVSREKIPQVYDKIFQNQKIRTR